MNRIRLALIDDHKIVRDGLRALLEGLARFEVVAEGGNGEEAVALATTDGIDVFLMDIAMPKLDGLDATAAIVAQRPDARIIILSMHATPDHARRALASGARGYMVKTLAQDELEQAILKVAGGGIYVSPSVDPDGIDARHTALADLSERQRQILLALANGKSTRDIAEALSISAKTVESHRSQLMLKLGIHDVPGLVKFALRHGMISID